MKKIYTLLLAVAVCTSALAQIPNDGFENWNNMGTYENPESWQTMNSVSVPNGHTSCEKSTDSHSGSYALKVSNNTSLGQMQGGWGLVATKNFDFPFKPAFAISGHPTSLGGWYKFNSLGGDTGLVMLVLFNQGAVVAQSSVELPAAANWTQFSYNMEPYTSADSATIIIFAFRTTGPNDAPNGNSSLWIDDISFGTSTGVKYISSSSPVAVYPNPAHGQVTLSNVEVGSRVTLYNILGEVVYEVKAETSTQVLDISVMPNGMYLVQVKNGTVTTTQKLVVR